MKTKKNWGNNIQKEKKIYENPTAYCKFKI